MGLSIKTSSIWNRIRERRKLLLFVIVFAAIGGLALFVTHAATPTGSLEAEDGTVNGATVVSDATASSGQAIKFGISSSIPTQTTTNLPINLPTQAWLKKGITSGSNSKLVFAHYFTQFTISESNTGDYYATSYLPPNGEGGAHAAYGGYLRERPLPVGYTSSSSYLLDDMKTEVTRATQAGLDGFTMDMLSLSGYHWTRMLTLLDAAQAVDSNFRIMLMPDATSLYGSTYQQIGDAIASIANDSTKSKALFYVTDHGVKRLVISPFGPEKQGAAFWQNFVNYMQTTKGIQVAFVPCYIGNTLALAPSYVSFSYGMSQWGERAPTASAGDVAIGNKIHTYKNIDGDQMIWMQPASYQDERPYSGYYAEARNGDNYRTSWGAANSTNAEWVQIPTWNDYSEEAEIAPSTHTGYNLLDLTSYYLTQYKMGGQNPPIVRDVAYLDHRVQNYGATVTNETQLMTHNLASDPLRDTAEVETFLTAPATVTFKVGANTYTYTAPAGASSQAEPLAAGTVSVSIARSGTTVASISSPYTVTFGSVAIQDFHYYYISSVSSRNPPAGY